MKSLEEKIIHEGTAIGSEIVKVDGFINHQIDTKFMDEIGAEFASRFADVASEVTKILTVEASGIAIASFAASHFGYIPMVFAKKTKPNTMTEEFYTAPCKSFTKGTVSELRVSKAFIGEGDKILILDDFLAHGEAGLALADIVEQAGATVLGIGAAIEKEFQGGSEKLRAAGYRVESLAVIESITDGKITFKK